MVDATGRRYMHQVLLTLSISLALYAFPSSRFVVIPHIGVEALVIFPTARLQEGATSRKTQLITPTSGMAVVYAM